MEIHTRVVRSGTTKRLGFISPRQTMNFEEQILNLRKVTVPVPFLLTSPIRDKKNSDVGYQDKTMKNSKNYSLKITKDRSTKSSYHSPKSLNLRTRNFLTNFTSDSPEFRQTQESGRKHRRLVLDDLNKSCLPNRMKGISIIKSSFKNRIIENKFKKRVTFKCIEA